MALGYEHVSEPLLVVEQFVYSAIALALAYVGYGITGVLLGYIIAMAISVGIGSTFLVKIIDVYGVLRKNVDVPRRQMMLFNVLSIVLSLLMISLYNFDVLLLRPIAGDNQTGYYKSALVVAQFVWIVPIAIQTLLLHSTAQLWNEGDHSTLNMIASRATKYTLVTTTLIIVGLATLADDFIPLYFGADFAVAVTPMILLLPGVLGFCGRSADLRDRASVRPAPSADNRDRFHGVSECHLESVAHSTVRNERCRSCDEHWIRFNGRHVRLRCESHRI